MNESVRLAIFDVDGTLIDSQHNIIAAMGIACRSAGLDLPRPEAVRRVIGLSLAEAIARLLPEQDDETHGAVTLSFREAIWALRARPDHAEPLFPGAALALAALEAEGWLLGLATGKSRRGVESMLERHGLQGVFVTIQTADANPGKPHPSMVLRAMAETGARPTGTVMIGDTVYDMVMGRSAQVRAAGVGWGYHAPEELMAAGAEIVIEDYAALPAGLSSLVGRPTCDLRQS
jgi:phosphoglycolate phosphatase